MASLLIPDQNRPPSVNLGKLSAILVAGRAIAAAEEVKIGLAGGQLPPIMGSSGRGWSPSKGYLGNLGWKEEKSQTSCVQLLRRKEV